MPPDILTVSELNRLARSALEREFPLLWVAGEVSNLTRAPSGHIYFTLKDEGAQVRCAMFRSRAQTLPFRLENGQQVEARALVTLYEPRGDYQLNVEALRRAGLGRLFEAFLRLKEALGREGLFDEAEKRPLPALPRRIGIVTSPRAAALSDVLAALARRAPHVPVIVYPTLVQGETAAGQIAAALAAAGGRGECDVLLLVRGGGSLEDLWAFNEEAVARALAACPLPVVSGVGHETDLTIADLAADRRAATPTAAAELASAGWFDAADALGHLGGRLSAAMRTRLEVRMQRIDLAGHRLVHPAERLARLRQRLDHLGARLLAAARWQAAGRRARLERLATALSTLNPQAVLARGYALVRDPEGRLVRSHRQLDAGSTLTLRFAEGGAEAVATRIFPD